MGAFLLLLANVPDYAIQSLALLPPDIKAMFPEDMLYWLGIGSVVGGIIARFFKQFKLDVLKKRKSALDNYE